MNYIDGEFIINPRKINYIYDMFIEDIRKIDSWKFGEPSVEGLLVQKTFLLYESGFTELPEFTEFKHFQTFPFNHRSSI